MLAGGESSKQLTAYFPRTIGLYKGNDVRVLGIKVGKVTSLTPDGDRVKVTMTYNGNQKIPANAVASLIEPSIVSDRYVQLDPAYTKGPVLAEPRGAAHEPHPHAARAGQHLREHQQPRHRARAEGRERQGCVVPADQRQRRATSPATAPGSTAPSRSSRRRSPRCPAAAATCSRRSSSLQKFTTTIAHNDGGVRALNANLATVGGQLAGERKDLGAALANLSTALAAVNTFVAANKTNLTGDIHGLASVSNVLTKEKEAITEFTDQAPLALSDLGLSFDSKATTLDTKADSSNSLTSGPGSALCQLLRQPRLAVRVRQVGRLLVAPGHDRPGQLAARHVAVAAAEGDQVSAGLATCDDAGAGRPRGRRDAASRAPTRCPLPGGAAHGKTYHVTAVFDDVQDLTPQAAVRVNDVAVGDVTGITVGKDLKAHVTMKINSTGAPAGERRGDS